MPLRNFYLSQLQVMILSPYLLCRAMMYGGLQESHQNEVEIKDANLTAFKILLKYIYKGFISLHNENVSLLLFLVMCVKLWLQY